LSFQKAFLPSTPKHFHSTGTRITKGLTFFLIFLSSIICEFTYCDTVASIAKSSISRQIEQPTITAILRDGNGFLWIGTQHGLYRFDGNKLTEFDSEQKGKNWIPASDIRAIAQDMYGDLVVATFGGGLLRWDSVSGAFVSLTEDATPEVRYLTHLVSSSSGYMWIAAKQGISLLDSKLSRDTSWLKKHPLCKNITTVNSMAEDGSENIFVASKSGVYRISAQEKSINRLALSGFNEERDGVILRIAFDRKNLLYAGTDTGNLFVFDLANERLITKRTSPNESSISITSLLVSNEILWIGTNNGLAYSDKSLSFYKTYRQDNSQISSNHVTSFLIDDKFIWVGTYQGLNTLSFVPFESFNKQNSGIFDDVLAFEEDTDGRLWIGTFNGIYLSDQSAQSSATSHKKLVSPIVLDQRIMTLAANGEEMWVGFRNSGAQVINTRTHVSRTPKLQNIGQLQVTKILHSTGGDTWIGTYNHGIIQISDGKERSFVKDGSLPETSVTVIFESELRGLLVGTERRIYNYLDSEKRFKKLDLALENGTRPTLVLSINQSKNNDIWIGTKDQGLFLWPEHNQRTGNLTIVPVGTTGELEFSTIYGIQFDSEGNAWCSTQRGLVKLSQGGEFLARFSTAEGLQGNDFNFGAAFSDSTGRIYFGGMNGYSRFSPDNVFIETSPPRVLVTNIDLPNRSLNANHNLVEPNTLTLTHKDYFVKFDFSVLDFLDPENNQYRYKLEGFDPDWIENGTRNSATYTNLPAGDYVLRVQGANSAGVWNREGASLNVGVEPPPWYSWWAFCIYGFSGSVLFWMAMRSYHSYAVERRAVQLATQMHQDAELADDEMQEQLEIQDDLVKSVYRHNVATLKLVADFIAKQNPYLTDSNDREAEQNSVKRINALAVLEACLYHQNDTLLADLNKFTDSIISRLLPESPISVETITTINEVSSQLIPFELASPLSIAIYELIENAIQHAFDEDSPANYIQITFGFAPGSTEQPTSQYQLTVQDNGLGMPGNIEPQQPETSGLAIVQSMAAKLSGTLSFTSERGTTVTLRFPSGNQS
jgi:ligand-binding sensor domain-containing protein/two-component sensor histidine kinase